MKKHNLFFLAAFLATLVAVTVLASGCFNKTGSSGPVSLTFYGLDNSDVFEPVIKAYQDNHTNVKIKYKKFNDPEEFENLLVNQLAEGEGPDIFYVHDTWLPRHIKKVVPLVSKTYGVKEFANDFVKVASDAFIQPSPDDGTKSIFAMPLYVDTLALYYNKRDFEQKMPERGKPAPTWDVIKEEADRLRDQTPDGKLNHGTIAFGRADNIHIAADILYNFFVQAGVNFYTNDFKQTQFAESGQQWFDYFLSFAFPQNKNFSWNTDLAAQDAPLGEEEAFLSGKVSAMMGYSDLYYRFENDLKNVRTRASSVISVNDIAVMPSPQISPDATKARVWSDFYGLAVSRNSKNPQVAWDFIQFAANKNSAQVFYDKTKRPTARRDLIDKQKKDPITGVFVGQVGYAASYAIFNDVKFAQFINQAITSTDLGQNSREALPQAQGAMNDLLKVEAPDGIYPKPKQKPKS